MRRVLHNLIGAICILASARSVAGFDFFQPLDPPRPFQVKVHRGLSCRAPENTRPALEGAITDQLEWAEVDVRLTRDGHHVLFHDGRLDGKSNGKGELKDRTLAELLALDAGAWFAPRYAGEKLLTLKQALVLAKGKINLDLDCKHVDHEQLVREVLEAGMEKQVVVFDDLRDLRRVRALSNERIAVMPKWHPPFGLDAWIDKERPAAVEIDADEITPKICRAFHRKGVQVQAKVLGQWDRPAIWRNVIEAGSDVLQTDLPEEILAEMLWKRNAKRPVRLAFHRGAGRYAPENTLPAFAKAIRMGADFVEFDVRPTADGVFCLLHDSKLDRTTNGTGPVKQRAWSDVAKLDAGAWFGRQYAGTRVPTFDAFLAAVKGQVDLYFDAKDIAPQALADAVSRHGMADRTVVYENAAYLLELKAIDPRIRALPPLGSVDELPALAKLEPYAVDASWRILSKEMIDKCHALGIAVFSDAPDNAGVEAYVRAIRWGIDLIQTDHPLRLIRAVELVRGKSKRSPPGGSK